MAIDAGVLQTAPATSGQAVFSHTPQPALMKNAPAVVRLVAQPWFREGLNADSKGEIAVTVKVEGVIQAGVLVKCVHRPSNIAVSYGKTDNNGEVTFLDLNRNAGAEYYVIAFSEQDYNALIYDKLTPV